MRQLIARALLGSVGTFLLAALALGGSVSAFAQPYPNKPIKVVVPWTPGQATDLSARIVAEKIAQSIGQPLVIDNRPGAGGVIGSDVVAKAPPDGYTVLAGSSGPLSINPLVQRVPFDTAKDFAPISLIATVPFVLVTHPSFPAADVKEFIKVVKANPGKYSFSSSGTGATAHLVGELFNSMAQLQALHVPYKGSGPSLTDVMGGQITYTFETVASVVSHVKAGRLRAYGLSGNRRNAAMPELAPIAEAADMPGFDIAAWIGYLAPAGTPREILDRLSAEVQKALQAPDVRERYLTLGMDPVSTTPDELTALIKRENIRYSAIVKQANIRLD
jgi:tripartite-type tricarboxylate transporter receptor subunit TctC